MSGGFDNKKDTGLELTAEELLLVQTAEDGVFLMRETTAPSATSGFGKLYVKTSDSLLYFKDDGGTEYSLTVSSGGTWGSITGTLSDQTDLQTALNGKQATLVSGTNIKTINGSSILASGDLTLLTSLSGALLATGATTGATSQAQVFTNGVITGKLYPSANSTTAIQILKADGTTSVLNVDTTNGRVGIGTTTPAGKLEVFDATASSIYLARSNSYASKSVWDYTGSVASIGTLGSDAFQIKTNGTARIYIMDSTGRIGINEASPANILSVNGGMSVGSQTYTRATAPSNGMIIEGKVGIGTTSPTAVLHLKAGTATANTAPLKFTSGTLLTTPEAGAVEFLTDDFYATITTGAARKAFILDDGTRLTSGKIPVATTNGRLVDVTPQTELTDELTTLTYTAPGTPDYAIQDLIDSSAGATFGFATKDEGNTVLSVIKNLQDRVNELETKLVALGLLVDAD